MAVVFAWALDFVRAMRERPLWAKILFRLAMGKYAYREFIGMMDAIEDDGYPLYHPFISYGLEEMDYHQDEIPLVDWWSKRKPLSRKE